MESKKIIADTNIWVALFNEYDSDHKSIVKYANFLGGEQMMPDLIFYETLTVLRNKSENNNPLNTFIEFATRSKLVNIRLFYENNADVLNLFVKEHKDGLSYIDTLLLFLSKDYHILTFDKKLKKRIKESGGNLIN
jgi:predicted nucleic acid-binding protein